MRKHSLYVKDILDAINQIEKFTNGMSRPKFQGDDKTSSAVVRKLEIISLSEMSERLVYAKSELICQNISA